MYIYFPIKIFIKIVLNIRFFSIISDKIFTLMRKKLGRFSSRISRLESLSKISRLVTDRGASSDVR